MPHRTLLVTGSSGLIGSEVCVHFAQHTELDIRDRPGVLELLAELKPDAIVHTAAQPSHDRAAAITFVHLSTNKVYGDRPNTIPLKELEGCWDYDDPDEVNACRKRSGHTTSSASNPEMSKRAGGTSP